MGKLGALVPWRQFSTKFSGITILVYMGHMTSGDVTSIFALYLEKKLKRCIGHMMLGEVPSVSSPTLAGKHNWSTDHLTHVRSGGINWLRRT